MTSHLSQQILEKLKKKWSLKSVITSINGFYLIHRMVMIPSPPPIWFAKSKLRPDQIAYLEKRRTEASE